MGIDFAALGLSRGHVMQALKNKNIGTRCIISLSRGNPIGKNTTPPMVDHKTYRTTGLGHAIITPNTCPLHLHTDSDVGYVIDQRFYRLKITPDNQMAPARYLRKAISKSSAHALWFLISPARVNVILPLPNSPINL